MPFSDPSPTQADVRFQLLGIPVRIHPLFWLAALLLGPHDPQLAVIWVPVVLVSIVVHEFGHALLQRRFGGQPRVVLYLFGGLAYGDGDDRSPWRQIAISLAGPGAGFLLAGLVWLLLRVVELTDSPRLQFMAAALLWVNIAWGLFNLLPIYPLDGGRVARELACLALRPDRGIVASLWLSIASCAAGAALLWSLTDSYYNLIFMAALAANNYQTLEAYRRSRYGGY